MLASICCDKKSFNIISHYHNFLCNPAFLEQPTMVSALKIFVKMSLM